MKEVYVVQNSFEETQHEFATQEEAEKYLAQIVEAYPGKLTKMEPKSPNVATIYVDFSAELFVFVLEKYSKASVYDITAEDVGSFVARQPDTVDMQTLAPGDKIGRWVDALISFSVSSPLQTRDDSEVNILFGNSDESNDLFTFEPKPPPHETILICYVASIQHDKKFKVYAEWGDRTDIEQTARRGRKVRDEAFARQLFPMLAEYEFITN